ncbi:hypothetical protein KC336_g16 [Hortaea werneckii]|nr:hypothetical protein KC336_g16 [Hortaea werneckii]
MVVSFLRVLSSCEGNLLACPPKSRAGQANASQPVHDARIMLIESAMRTVSRKEVKRKVLLEGLLCVESAVTFVTIERDSVSETMSSRLHIILRDVHSAT